MVVRRWVARGHMVGGLLIIVSCLVGVQLRGAEPQRPPLQFLAVSDIHFNPFFDLNQGQFARLAALPVGRWSAFFAKRRYPLSGTAWPNQADSNYRLMSSVLAAAAEQIPDPAFVVYPGDFLCHLGNEEALSEFVDLSDAGKR
jgi:hypothetical protein